MRYTDCLLPRLASVCHTLSAKRPLRADSLTYLQSRPDSLLARKRKTRRKSSGSCRPRWRCNAEVNVQRSMREGVLGDFLTLLPLTASYWGALCKGLGARLSLRGVYYLGLFFLFCTRRSRLYRCCTFSFSNTTQFPGTMDASGVLCDYALAFRSNSSD